MLRDMVHRGTRLTAPVVAASVLGLVGACSTPPPAAIPPNKTQYALGVAAGECPPDIAFYHAVAEGATDLGVVSAPTQIVTYSVSLRDSATEGPTGSAVIAEGTNGHTFRIDVPISRIVGITVTATGAPGELPSACAAVSL